MSEQSLDSLFEEAVSIKKQIDELTSKVSGSLLGKLADVVPEKFKDINFKCILAYGYTPGFNDGDPCTHNFNLAYGKRTSYSEDSLYFDFDELDDFEEFFSEEDIDCSDIDPRETNIIPLISDEDGKVIESFFDGFNLLCEQIGVTNFKIKIYKKNDGEILVDIDEEYYVGY